MPTPHDLIQAQQWIGAQTQIQGNILPIRKHKNFKLRGTVREIDGRFFMAVDNEPLVHLYDSWCSGQHKTLSIKELLESKAIPASWKCDAGKSAYRFCGINTHARKHGLKLCHIVDAGSSEGLMNGREYETRFMRTMSPLNLFLFPSSRLVNFSIEDNPQNVRFEKKDLGECDYVQALAWAMICQRISEVNTAAYNAVTLFGRNSIESTAGIIENSKAIVVRAKQKAVSRMSTSQSAKGVKVKSSIKEKKQAGVATTSDSAFRKFTRKNAVSVYEAVVRLNAWRKDNPQACRLDGQPSNASSNPAGWLHIRVGGYIDEVHSFVGVHGGTFKGSDYNGIVNFHGDTKTESIDRFIRLIETAEDYRDVLVPSATYQTMSLPKNRRERPKFGLKGFTEKVEAFYLYHDDWKPGSLESSA